MKAAVFHGADAGGLTVEDIPIPQVGPNQILVKVAACGACHTDLHYIEHGGGFPVLLFAPGGMRSASSFWKSAPWNPVTELADEFRVISMDQRNAGRSTAPISPDAAVAMRPHASLTQMLPAFP